jgi:Flp pilus assembly protein TadG
VRTGGQALVEFALIAPVFMLFLLGTLAAGIYYLAAVQQANAGATVAAWVAGHPSDDPEAVTAAVVPCPGGATIATDGDIVTVTIVCPCIAGDLLPFLPRTVETTATAFVPAPPMD